MYTVYSPWTKIVSWWNPAWPQKRFSGIQHDIPRISQRFRFWVGSVPETHIPLGIQFEIANIMYTFKSPWTKTISWWNPARSLKGIFKDPTWHPQINHPNNLVWWKRLCFFISRNPHEIANIMYTLNSPWTNWYSRFQHFWPKRVENTGFQDTGCPASISRDPAAALEAPIHKNLRMVSLGKKMVEKNQKKTKIQSCDL